MVDPSGVECFTLTLEHAPKSMIMAYWYYSQKSTNEVLVASATVQVEWRSPHQVNTVSYTLEYLYSLLLHKKQYRTLLTVVH